ncbi:cyclohexanone monooxygenase [Cladophialophora psammophila CBS 110553]|uniref:Cyclohexanone monooxygenase n=1 Tax=Cladophialophora psammophila CBS 110553 TaxID=1182543 RepID=W9XNE8_9EURO|nr:cyclohexanone monooxygenase [Cladophialophora psammophila CBS 110553]EXJ71854.1 cyclohexanone monooxygenase [Cladophialophora psammophila CBS 110553]
MASTTVNKLPNWLDAEGNFDADALQAKYREERDKRLRTEGLNQYQSVDESALKHYAEDIWTPRVERSPIEENIDYLIVGAGFSGMLLAVRLIEAGISDIKIVDKAGDFGGTWYWNQYPGAACDIEAYIYMPLLDETGYVPTEKYARGPELYEHSRRIAQIYGLYNKALLQTEVETLIWNEVMKCWEVSTNRGDKIHARFVTTAGGLLHKMKFPGVSGIDSFKGHSFHTSRWDYSYTGGNQQGNLTGLSDKRVAIIGTGATALQAVPQLGRWAKHLYVFQRTPSSVDVRLDQPTDPEWAKTLTKGWQQRRMNNFNILVSGGHQDEDLVSDGWTDILTNISISGKMVEENRKAANPVKAAEELQKRMQLADFKKMEQVRQRVDSIVEDPETANSLKPWYNFMCKRPGFHNDYLPTFNRPNVTLVDTQGKGIEKITEKGVVADGKEYEVDCIVYATGFEYIGNDYSQRMRIQMKGRNGVALHEHWKDGPRTFHGLYTRGFPNHFIMSVTQSAVAPNFSHMLNEQAKHIAYVVAEASKREATMVETSAEAEQEWIDTIIELGKLREDFLRECTPSYYNDEGKISRKTLQNGRYGLGSPAFVELLEDWRAAGTLQGLEFDGEPVANVPAVANHVVTASEKVPLSEHIQGVENLIPVA